MARVWLIVVRLKVFQRNYELTEKGQAIKVLFFILSLCLLYLVVIQYAKNVILLIRNFLWKKTSLSASMIEKLIKIKYKNKLTVKSIE